MFHTEFSPIHSQKPSANFHYSYDRKIKETYAQYNNSGKFTHFSLVALRTYGGAYNTGRSSFIPRLRVPVNVAKSKSRKSNKKNPI